MNINLHDMVAALFDTPREYIDALVAAGASPKHELDEALECERREEVNNQ